MSANADQIIDLFSQATAKSSLDEREQFLAAACHDQPELREQLESLLQAHDAAGGFLKNMLALPTSEPLTEKAGTLIGRYKLLQKIGEGGCGVVYMAQQEEPVRRRVALKIIKLGMDTSVVIARFEAERQALAMMDHPNIAKIFDAGVTGASVESQISNLQSQIHGGRPYFVMESTPLFALFRPVSIRFARSKLRADSLSICFRFISAHFGQKESFNSERNSMRDSFTESNVE
jgi:hypothetical protein